MLFCPYCGGTNLTPYMTKYYWCNANGQPENCRPNETPPGRFVRTPINTDLSVAEASEEGLAELQAVQAQAD